MTTIEELRNYAKGCFRGESQKASQLMTKAATELEILTKERDDFCKANERNVRELQSQLTTAHLDNERLREAARSSLALLNVLDEIANQTGNCSITAVSKDRFVAIRGQKNVLRLALTTPTPTLETGRNALRTAIGMGEFNPPQPTPNPIEQELKELHRDKERLDWLNANFIQVSSWQLLDGNKNVNLKVTGQKETEAPNVRQAIDSASKERTTT